MHVCCHPSPSRGNTVGDITPLPIAAIFRRIDACNCQQLEHTSMLTRIHPIAHTTSLNILQAVNPVRTYLYYPRRHEAGCYKRKQLVLSETPGRTCVALESSKGDITRPGCQSSVCMITVKSEFISRLEK